MVCWLQCSCGFWYHGSTLRSCQASASRCAAGHYSEDDIALPAEGVTVQNTLWVILSWKKGRKHSDKLREQLLEGGIPA
jgi:hypothetical protein